MAIRKDVKKEVRYLNKDFSSYRNNIINFAKNNWGHPENAVPSLSAMETYAKNEAANQATLEGP